MKSLVVVLLFAASLYGQSIDASVGGSQLYDSSGLQLTYEWRNFSGWAGAGYAGGPQLGGLISMKLNDRERLSGGDQRLPGFLEVDRYDTHNFTVRGFSYTRSSKDSSIQLFSGLLTEETLTPYLHSFSSKSFSHASMNAVLYQKKWGAFRLHSLNLMGDKLTSIQSLSWKPSTKLLFAGAAGLGSGSPYVAGSGEYTSRQFHFRGSYTVTDRAFHRQEALVNTEPLGLNVRADYKPFSKLSFGAEHEHTTTYLRNYPIAVATFNSVYVSASMKGFQLNGSASTSNVNTYPGQMKTEVFSVTRRILPRWRSFASVVRLDSPLVKQTYYVAMYEFRINSHLAVRQNYNRMNGQNSNSLGVTWSSNPISFSIDQQLYISPIAAAFGGKTVFQAWTFSIRFRSFRGTTANIDTSVGPDGRTKWGTYLSGLRYSAVAPVAEAPAFSNYVVKGVVVDEAGKGVWGIAVQIGDVIVVSGRDGEFFTHVKGAKQLPVSIMKDASLQPLAWMVRSAPPVVAGVPESSASAGLRIVVTIAEAMAANNP